MTDAVVCRNVVISLREMVYGGDLRCRRVNQMNHALLADFVGAGLGMQAGSAA